VDRGYVPRQLCLQALRYSMGELADTARRRLTSPPDPDLCPRWTTVVTRPPALELGADDVWVTPVAVLSDGDVITGNALGLVRQWRTDEPGVPAELGSQDSAVSAVAVLFDDRVVTGGGDGRVRLWRTDQPGVPVELVFGNGDWDEEVTAVAEISDGRLVTGHAGGSVRLRRNFYDAPVELGTHVDAFHWGVTAVAVLSDRCVVTAGSDWRVRLWRTDQPGVPIEIGTNDGEVTAVAVLGDGSVVIGGRDGRVRLWPARRAHGAQRRRR